MDTQTYRIEIRFDKHGTLEEAQAAAQAACAHIDGDAEVTAIFDENWDEV